MPPRMDQKGRTRTRAAAPAAVSRGARASKSAKGAAKHLVAGRPEFRGAKLGSADKPKTKSGATPFRDVKAPVLAKRAKPPGRAAKSDVASSKAGKAAATNRRKMAIATERIAARTDADRGKTVHMNGMPTNGAKSGSKVGKAGTAAIKPNAAKSNGADAPGIGAHGEKRSAQGQPIVAPGLALANSGEAGASGASLPTGYHPSEGEPFMNERQRAYFRNKLIAWKEDIIRLNRETLQGLTEDSAQHADVTDRATFETDRALELRARDRQRKLISKIDAALARIEDGSYGYCEETGDPISLKRLEARPIATLSIEAQERHERRERVFRED